MPIEVNEPERLLLDEEFMDALDRGEVPAEILKMIEDIVNADSIGSTEVDNIQPPDLVPEAAEYTHKLGTHNLPNQSRVHMHGVVPRVETRSQKWEVFVTFRHPTMSDFVNHAVSCVGAAAVSSVITAVATNSPQAGLAIFKPSWWACMKSRLGNAIANQIQVELSRKKIVGTWSGH